MVIESNNIHASRMALSQLEAICNTIDEIAMEDIFYSEIDTHLANVRQILESKLCAAERVLIDTL